MRPTVHGIHHVTAIAGDPQENLDFYVGVLGMRLVKKSVNQDSTNTYHFFYADAVGTPGSDLTFFPWPEMGPGRPGIGLAMEVSFSVLPGSLPYWKERLEKQGIAIESSTRFGDPVLTFADPHGLRLALVETAAPRETVVWTESPVPAEHQIRGMHAVRLWERSSGATAGLLTERMGFTLVAEEDGWKRYGVDGGGAGRVVDVKEFPGEPRGMWGAGAIHHVAWRTKDVEEEMAVRASVEAAGLRPTPLIDRFWFESVYFKEPGGVLFELATDGPGFERDEKLETLGEQLILPPWLEPQRAAIEASLPRVETPRVQPKR